MGKWGTRRGAAVAALPHPASVRRALSNAPAKRIAALSPTSIPLAHMRLLLPASAPPQEAASGTLPPNTAPVKPETASCTPLNTAPIDRSHLHHAGVHALEAAEVEEAIVGGKQVQKLLTTLLNAVLQHGFLCGEERMGS